MQEKGECCDLNCDICYEKQKEQVTLDCKHSLCSKCFILAVLPKEICPFCKQSVNSVIQRNQILDIKQFQKPIVEMDFFEESHFDLVNDGFFREDIIILHENLGKAHNVMSRTVKQLDEKFNEKWFIFEQIEQNIQMIDFRDSIETFRIITKLNVMLFQIMNNNWNNELLNEFKQLYIAENVFENQFQIKEKRNKRRKQKRQQKE